MDFRIIIIRRVGRLFGRDLGRGRGLLFLWGFYRWVGTWGVFEFLELMGFRTCKVRMGMGMEMEMD